jgi:hypothetical protein
MPCRSLDLRTRPPHVSGRKAVPILLIQVCELSGNEVECLTWQCLAPNVFAKMWFSIKVVVLAPRSQDIYQSNSPYQSYIEEHLI